VEALRDAVAGDLDAVGVLRLERAVLEGRVEEVDYGKRKALVRVGGLEGSVSGWGSGSAVAFRAMLPFWCIDRCDGVVNV
jgi:hypothetical protein